MIRLQNRKSKSSQYLISGVIAVIILAAWISLPLMSNSSLDSSVAAGNPFKSRVTDINSLYGDIPSEGGAPGSPLSGEMTDNPATSGESMASSLFQSGPGGEDAPAADKASAGAPMPAIPDKYSASAPSPGAGGAKLAPQASITAGNSNSMSTGGARSKFFGTGGAKTDFVPADAPRMKGVPEAGKKNSLVAMLGDTANKSKQAVRTNSMDGARGGAASAFEKSAKADTSDLTTNLEQGAASSGLALGQAAQNLKSNDPSLSSNKSRPPDPIPQRVDNTEEEIKRMLLQMVIQATLGQMFGAMGQMMAQAINPGYQERQVYQPIGQQYVQPGQYQYVPR